MAISTRYAHVIGTIQEIGHLPMRRERKGSFQALFLISSHSSHTQLTHTADTRLLRLRVQPTLRPHNTHHILIRHHMRQSTSLRHMLRTRTPHEGILETILHTPMQRVADVLNRASVPHNQRFGEIGIHAFALRVDAYQIQFGPAAVDDVAYAQVEFAAHDGRVGFAGEAVEEFEIDAVDFVVHVQAFDVCAVVFHDDVDELVDGGCGVL